MCETLLLKVEEAARRLSLGRSVTYRYVQTGALKSVKLGGARRIVVSDLHEFIRRLREETDDAFAE